MGKIIFVAVLLLAACGQADPLKNADTLCKDGVEYMSFYKISSSGSVSISVVPHFKRDGSLYPCATTVKKG